MKNIYVNKFKKYLTKNNLLWSSERQTICENIFLSDSHFSADELFVEMKHKKLSISRATVYRTLELMEKCHLVSKIQLENGQHLYEKTTSEHHHDHLICQDCGKIIEFSSTEIESIQKDICKNHNFEMRSHILRICGLCENCQKKEYK